MREVPQVRDKPPGGRADAIRNRRQLLSAAAEFVTQVGAEKVTMDGLASYSGLGKGTVSSTSVVARESFERFSTRRSESCNRR
jgi:hypothetical protein